ncbi:MAG: hypothetical protein HY784_12820 [Chloroflexi bacterium]|nr:hypothetical protein [Chloroflexota bacterium]
MSRKFLRALAALSLLSLLVVPLAVWAHESITAGNYTIEYGRLNELPVVGQPNSVVVDISGGDGGSGDPKFNVDISAFQLEVSYGGQSKTLDLQPLPDGQPGQLLAALTPARAGKYTLKFNGALNGSSVPARNGLSLAHVNLLRSSPEAKAALDKAPAAWLSGEWQALCARRDTLPLAV